MMKKSKMYLAKYNHGLLNDTKITVFEGDDPVKCALAEYRRNSGEVNLLSNLNAKFVVKSVEPLED